MTFDQIQSFYWVAVLGTYRVAAEKQNTTQPAISARIKALEAVLGASLFDRSGHRVVLTPHGRRFLNYAEEMLELKAKAIRDAGRSSGVSGTIRIGASDTIAASWFPSFISHLGRKFPEAYFEAHVEVTYRLLESLIQRRLDIAFLVGPISHPELVEAQLCAYSGGFVASPQLGISADQVLSIDDIARMTVFTFDKMTRPYHDLKVALRNSSISGFRISSANTLQAIAQLVSQGLGAGYVQLAAVEREIQSGQLMVLKTDFQLPDTNFCVSYPDTPGSFATADIAREAKEFLKAQKKIDTIKLLF